MKKTACMIFCLFAGIILQGQNMQIIKGRVTSERDGKEIGNCSIFINNSSRGTTSNEKGEFALSNIPPGQHELIVSSIGYKTYVMVFTDKQLPLDLQIKLTLKPAELESVTVNPFLADGWAQWGKFFIDQFIGTYGNATNCFIRNKDKIRFRLTDNQTRLRAVADEPLIIENKALGYLIYYSLEDFVFDLTKNTLIFTGYPIYQEMQTTNEKTRNTWEKNRRTAYLGSLYHFIRALYSSTINVEGFFIRQVLHTENFEKNRVMNFCLSKQMIREDSVKNRIHFLPAWKSIMMPKDSLTYFEKVLKQPDFFDGEDTVFAHEEQIVLTNAANTKYLFFPNKLVVYYRNAPEDPAYVRASGKMKIEKYQKSIVYLTGSAPISIWPDGNYYPPQEIFISSYWAWLGKMCNRVPVDYVLPAEHH